MKFLLSVPSQCKITTCVGKQTRLALPKHINFHGRLMCSPTSRAAVSTGAGRTAQQPKLKQSYALSYCLAPRVTCQGKGGKTFLPNPQQFSLSWRDFSADRSPYATRHLGFFVQRNLRSYGYSLRRVSAWRTVYPQQLGTAFTQSVLSDVPSAVFHDSP